MEQTSRSTDTRQRIIDAAVILFARKGFAATGMRELAREAEVNLAMINYFFGSKTGLLKEILDTFYSGAWSLAQRHLSGPRQPEQKIRQFIRHATEYFNSHKHHLIIAITELPHDESEITQYKAVWVRRMMEIISVEICEPLRERRGIDVAPVVIGPLLVSMMSSRFLFAPMIETVNPPGLKEQYLDRYPDIVAGIFLEGLRGITNDSDEGTCG